MPDFPINEKLLPSSTVGRAVAWISPSGTQWDTSQKQRRELPHCKHAARQVPRVPSHCFERTPALLDLLRN